MTTMDKLVYRCRITDYVGTIKCTYEFVLYYKKSASHLKIEKVFFLQLIL